MNTNNNDRSRALSARYTKWSYVPSQNGIVASRKNESIIVIGALCVLVRSEKALFSRCIELFRFSLIEPYMGFDVAVERKPLGCW